MPTLTPLTEDFGAHPPSPSAVASRRFRVPHPEVVALMEPQIPSEEAGSLLTPSTSVPTHQCSGSSKIFSAMQVESSVVAASVESIRLESPLAWASPRAGSSIDRSEVRRGSSRLQLLVTGECGSSQISVFVICGCLWF
jgi:hypothetical protein